MQPKNNLTLATRLALGFAALIALLLATSAYSWWSLYGLKQQVTAITGEHLVRLDQLADVKDNVNVVARAVRNLVLADDPAEKQAEAKRVAEARARNTEVLEALTVAARDAETQALLKGISDARGAFWSGMERTMALGLENKDAEARALLNKDVRVGQVARPLQPAARRRCWPARDCHGRPSCPLRCARLRAQPSRRPKHGLQPAGRWRQDLRALTGPPRPPA